MYVLPRERPHKASGILNETHVAKLTVLVIVGFYIGAVVEIGVLANSHFNAFKNLAITQMAPLSSLRQSRLLPSDGQQLVVHHGAVRAEVPDVSQRVKVRICIHTNIQMYKYIYI